jgi:hypothetical protein
MNQFWHGSRIRWFWRYVKNDFVGSTWIIRPEDLQVGFGIIAATKANDNP